MRRKRTVLVLLMGAAVAVAVAAVALAQETQYAATCLQSSTDQEDGCPGGLIARFGAWVAPTKLPRHEQAPIGLGLQGKISSREGTASVSALREATFEFDRNIAINVNGLPICDPPRLGYRPLDGGWSAVRKACRGTAVGEGKVDFEIFFPNGDPIRLRSPVVAYNGGLKAGVATFYVLAYITVPAPTLIVTRVEVRRTHKGRYGLRAVVKLPVIAGGYGSLVDFKLKLRRFFSYKGSRRSFLTARCPRGELSVNASRLLFKNEAKTPGVPPTTLMRRTFILPCRPTH